MASIYQKLWEDARKAKKSLPAGHYGRKKAQDRYKKSIDATYTPSRELEDFWMRKLKVRKWKGRKLTPSRAASLVDHICAALGEARRPTLQFRQDIWGLGEYRPLGRKLSFKLGNPCFSTVIHELAHYLSDVNCQYMGHGAEFLLMEELAFQASQDWVKKEKEGILC